MGVTQSYPFSDNVNYTFSNVENVAGSAQLVKIPNPGQVFSEDFADDTGFTYDSAKAEFIGGLLRQKDQRPANATFHSNFNIASVNANWGVGSLTGTNTGGTLNAGKLELLGGVSSKYLDYVATGNADSLQTGCVRLKITPGYSGTPSTTQFFFRLAAANGSTGNVVGVHHAATSGKIALRIFNSAGTSIITVDLGVWVPVSGTEYEFELNWDITTGATRLFINGVQHGATQTQTGTRSGGVGLLRIGEISILGSNFFANFTVDSIMVFSTVQHTANYTPAAYGSDYIYLTSKADLPNFSYSDIGAIQALTDLAVTEVGTPRYILEGKYWNGTSWAASDGSYVQSNSFATVLTNLSSLSVVGETTISVSVVFDNAATLSSVDDLTLTYTGQKYPLTGYIEPLQGLAVQALISYDHTATHDTDTQVRLILKVDGVLKYWNGSAWVNSNGLEAQSNTLADFSANIADIDLGTNSEIIIRWLFITTDVSQTSTLDIATLEYDFGAIFTDPLKCLMYGYITGIDGEGVEGATVTFTLKKKTGVYSEAQGSIVADLEVVATTDENGYFEASLIRSSEFEGSGTYKVVIEYSGTTFTKTSAGKIEITVPDATTKDITDLITDVA